MTTNSLSAVSLRLRQAAFKEAMSRFPSGVTIVTTADEAGVPWGFTASAFCSVSLKPPQILVCVIHGSGGHRALLASDHFAVNVLSDAHRETALRFATPGLDRFSGDEIFWRSTHKVPILSGAVATVECSVANRIDSGDHLIVIGDVLNAGSVDADPMIYSSRTFRGLGEELA